MADQALAARPFKSLTDLKLQMARVLQAAQHIHILITGPEKRQALDRAQTLPPELAPIRTVLDQATVHWAE